MGTNLEDFTASMRTRAEGDVKYELAIEKIAELEKPEVTDEDIETEYADTAESVGLDVEKVKEIVAKDYVEEQIKMRKASRIVIDSAVAVAPEKEDKPAKKAAKKPAAKKTDEAKEEAASDEAKAEE